MSKSVSQKNPGQRGASAVVPSWLELDEPPREATCEYCGRVYEPECSTATRSESWCSDVCEDRFWESHDEQ
jgi:hypothetical protein